MNTLNDLLAAYDRALTAYDDCPESRDAHTLAASRFHGIAYEDVTPTQRTLMKQSTYAYRYHQTITVDREIVVTEQVPPGYSLRLEHPGSITGRVSKREPEWQGPGHRDGLSKHLPKLSRAEIARRLADFTAGDGVGEVLKAAKRRADERTRDRARNSRVDPRVLNQPCMAFDYTPLELQVLARLHAQGHPVSPEAEPGPLDGATQVSFRVSATTIAALS